MAEKMQIVVEVDAKSGTATLKQLENEIGNVENKSKHASGAIDSMTGSIAEMIKGAVGFGAIKAMISESIAAVNDYQSGLMGLASVARYAGQDMQQTLNKSMELTKDGLLSTTEAATAMKNLLSRGFSTDQAITLINRFKDSAAFGRQASLGFGEAIVTATEGLKNENSILVDNAGVTKNVAKMWADWAKAHNTNTNAMTMAQKREAEYNGIIEETAAQQGNAALMADSFQGSQARLNKEIQDSKIALGQALLPAMRVATDAFKGLIEYGVKPTIFFFKTLGIDIGETVAMIAERIDFMTSPSRWNTKGLEEYHKRIKVLGDLAEKERIRISTEMNSVQTPEMGKDTGARRQEQTAGPDQKAIEKAKKEAEKRAKLARDIAETERSMEIANARTRLSIQKASEDSMYQDRVASLDADRALQQARGTWSLQDEADYLAKKAEINAASVESEYQIKQAQAALDLANDLAKYDNQIQALKDKHMLTAAIEQQFEIERAQRIEQAQANEVAMGKDKNAKILAANRAADAAQMKAQTDMTKFFVALRAGEYASAMGFANKLATGIGAHNKAMFEANKAVSISKAVQDTYASAVGAYKAMSSIPYVGPVLGAAAAAAAIAYGLRQVQMIKSTPYGGGSVGGSGAPPSVPGGVGAAPSAPAAVAPPAQPQQPSQAGATIHLTVSALDPSSVDPSIMQKIGEKLAPVIQENFNNNTQLQVRA